MALTSTFDPSKPNPGMKIPLLKNTKALANGDELVMEAVEANPSDEDVDELEPLTRPFKRHRTKGHD